MEEAHRIAEIDGEKRRLQAELRALNDERGNLEQIVLDKWSHAGIRNVKLDNGATVYCHRSSRVRTAADREQAISCLLEKFRDISLLNVGTQRLSALAREDEAFRQELMDTGMFEIEDVVSIRTMKS